MILRHQTELYLRLISTTDWFQHVGEPSNDDYPSVQTWQEAAKAASSKQWSFVLGEARNVLTGNLHEKCNTKYQQWNAITMTIKPVVQKIEEQTFAKVSDLSEIERTDLGISLSWCLLTIGMEEEYGDDFKTPFFQEVWRLLQQGRFPCGWVGKIYRGRTYDEIQAGRLRTLKEGRLVIF